MERKIYLRNITGTVIVVGMAISAMNFNSTQVVENIKIDSGCSIGNYDDYTINSTFGTFQNDTNIYIQNEDISVIEEAESLFGVMREATEAELESINNYIRSISIETGVDFFSLC